MAETRAGYVVLVGRPNAGKSTLLNRLVGQKLSIVTPKPQTTRERVVGITTSELAQMVFLDTPGLLEPQYLLHNRMMDAARAALESADVVLLVLDSTRPPEEAEIALELAEAHRRTGIVVLNKRDLVSGLRLNELADWAAQRSGWPALPISAKSGDGVEELEERTAALLPPGPFLYPADEISSQSLRFFAAELIRETIWELYQEEIPYSVAVGIEEFREDRSPILIRATIFVERASQKTILIGSGGSAIKRLGTLARSKLTELIGASVYLDLWVKVVPNWRRSPDAMRRVGLAPNAEQR